MLRLLAVLGFVILCYYFPSSYSQEYLESAKIDENAARSFYLCFAIMLVWPALRSLWVIGIELTLIACDAYTKYHMPSGGIFNEYYSLLHQAAYLLEIAILITFITIEWRKIGKLSELGIHRNMFNRRADSHSAGDHN